VGCVFVAANNAHHSLPSVAGTPTAARPSPMCFALAGVRVLTVLVSGFVRALLALGFLSSKAKRLSSPVCGFAANGGGGSVVLLGFAQ